MSSSYQMDTIGKVKQGILDIGGLIISRGKSKKDFVYMLGDGFGYVELDSLSHEVKLSSLYESSKIMGTGSEYKDHGPYVQSDLFNATRALIGHGNVNWFQSLENYLIQSFFLFQYTVESSQSIKPAIEYIDDVYIYISEKHATYVNKRRIEMDRFLKRNDKFQTLFHLKDGRMHIIETNLNDDMIAELDNLPNVDKILKYANFTKKRR